MQESLMPGERETSRPAESEGPPGWRRETRITLAVALVFGLLMVAQERQILAALAHGSGVLPGLTWRLPWPLFFVAIALPLPLRARIAFLGLSGLFFALVVVGDASYFRFFGSVTSLVSAGTAHQLWDVRDSVLQLLQATDALFALAFLALAALAILPGRHLTGEAPPLPRAPRLTGSIGLLALAFALHSVAWRTPIYEDTHHLGREKWVMPAEHWGSRFSHATYAETFGLYNYHLHDLLEFVALGRSRTPMTEAEQRAIDVVVAHKQALNRIDTPFAGVAAGRRVVMIQLEAIVHWLLDLEVDGTPVMPFLSSLQSKGLSWDYVMDVTAIGRTSDAEFAVMTGLLPDTTRPNSFAHPDRAPTYLPRSLKALGYPTASYHGYKKSFWNRTYTHPVYGIDEMFFDETYPTEKILGLGVPDPVVYDFMLERLEQEQGPSFSFMISLSSHHPFVYTPAEYNALFPSLTLEDGWGLVGPYLRSARYTDDALAAFFDGMEARGLLEDTLFVIYGDHDMGGLHTGRTLPEVGPLAYTIAEDRVPFLVVIPGEEDRIARFGAQHTNATAGLHDTYPTILHLLGEPVPRGVLGTNLLVPDDQRDPVPLPPVMGDVLFAYRHTIQGPRGGGPIDPRAEPEPAPPTSIPSLREGVREQLIVRELLDHPEYWSREPVDAGLVRNAGRAVEAGLVRNAGRAVEAGLVQNER